MPEWLAPTTKETVYRVGKSDRRGRRITDRPSHIYTVDRVRIGNDYQGNPIFTEYSYHRALCGVYVMQTRDTERLDPQSASCPTCRRKHFRLFSQDNPPSHR